MKELSNLSIKELIESIEENFLETKVLRKRLLIEMNQEKDVNRKMSKKEMVERCNEKLYRFRMQKLELEEMMKDHAAYGYKKLGDKVNEKTAQEEQVQEQLFNIMIDSKLFAKTFDDYLKQQQTKSNGILLV